MLLPPLGQTARGEGQDDEEGTSTVGFTVTMAGSAGGDTRVDHPEADSVAVEEGHLVLRAHRAIVGIYAPGRWHSVVEARPGRPGGGRRVGLAAEVRA